MASDRKARYERRQTARQRRDRESRSAQRRNLLRTLMIGAAGLAAAVLIVGGFFLYSSTRKLLPPTSFSPAHSEQFPPSQINFQPIPYLIQEHVMERGGGNHRRGSMLIQYNCDDYECEPDLVEKLEALVGRYPPQVYLAPFPGMDAKIALAAPGRREVLEEFDEERIRRFIEKNLDR